MRKLVRNRNVYLCFPKGDEQLADKFKAEIQRDRIYCFPVSDMEPLNDIRVEACACVVLLFTERAYGDPRVEHVITKAYALKKPIYPCYFSEEPVPEPLCDMLDLYLHHYVGCLMEHELIARIADQVHQEILGF